MGKHVNLHLADGSVLVNVVLKAVERWPRRVKVADGKLPYYVWLGDIHWISEVAVANWAEAC